MNNIFVVKGKFSFRKLLAGILISMGTGILSAFLSIHPVQNSIENYQKLKLPPYTPPILIFGVIWMILFFIMSISAYRIWMLGIKNEEVQDSLLYYIMQLALNFLWCILFLKFGLRKLALLDITVLLITIIITSVKFYKLDKTSGGLMLPYIFWAFIAAIFNYAVWILNR